MNIIKHQQDLFLATGEEIRDLYAIGQQSDNMSATLNSCGYDSLNKFADETARYIAIAAKNENRKYDGLSDYEIGDRLLDNAAARCADMLAICYMSGVTLFRDCVDFDDFLDKAIDIIKDAALESYYSDDEN